MTISGEIHEDDEEISKAPGGRQFNLVHPLFTDRLKGERPSSEADPAGESTKLHMLTEYPFGSTYLPSFESLEFERPVQQRPVIWENPNGSFITMIPVTPDAQELRAEQEKARKHEARFKRHDRHVKYQKGGVEARCNETQDTTFDSSQAGASVSAVTKLILPSARKFAFEKAARRPRLPEQVHPLQSHPWQIASRQCKLVFQRTLISLHSSRRLDILRCVKQAEILAYWPRRHNLCTHLWVKGSTIEQPTHTQNRLMDLKCFPHQLPRLVQIVHLAEVARAGVKSHLMPLTLHNKGHTIHLFIFQSLYPL
jgi:hypothetical protein